MLDRRTLVAIFLALGFYYLWMTWVIRTSPPVAPEAPPEAPAVTEPVEAPAPPPSVVPPASEIPVRDVAMQGCGIEGLWSTDGGVLRNVKLPEYPAASDVLPLWRWALQGFSPRPWKPYAEGHGAETVITADGAFLSAGSGSLASPSPRMTVIDESPTGVGLQGLTGDAIEITKRARIVGTEECFLEAEVIWRNTASQAFDGGVWVGAHDLMDPEAGARDNAFRPFAMYDGDVDTRFKLSKLSEPERVEGTVGWFGVADRYFAALVVPAEGSTGALWFSPRALPAGTGHGAHYVVSKSLAPGEAHTERFRLFLGPKKVERLRTVDESLTAFVDYDLGWFAAVAKPLLWLLRQLHGLLGNWGLAIMGLTFLVKLVFFPLTQMSFRSSQAMQAIQPKMGEIREKFKDNPEELNRQTVELFRESGVNPLGGCLPMLVQMPVWIALYQVLLSSSELYHTEFLYLRDLSAPDPYGALPLVTVGLMVLQQRMMPMAANMDPTQQKVLQLMPLIFGIFFFTFPSGLVVYIFVNMVLTIMQQWLIKRQFEIGGPAAAAKAGGS